AARPHRSPARAGGLRRRCARGAGAGCPARTSARPRARTGNERGDDLDRPPGRVRAAATRRRSGRRLLAGRSRGGGGHAGGGRRGRARDRGGGHGHLANGPASAPSRRRRPLLRLVVSGRQAAGLHRTAALRRGAALGARHRPRRRNAQTATHPGAPRGRLRRRRLVARRADHRLLARADGDRGHPPRRTRPSRAVRATAAHHRPRPGVVAGRAQARPRHRRLEARGGRRPPRRLEPADGRERRGAGVAAGRQGPRVRPRHGAGHSGGRRARWTADDAPSAAPDGDSRRLAARL
ncbi:MAG: tolB protein precursor, periplasmic protein involved in the tonb-independent uptake of group A colicins, partial [uncultured Solirubrobacteraceae bacterium]